MLPESNREAELTAGTDDTSSVFHRTDPCGEEGSLLFSFLLPVTREPADY